MLAHPIEEEADLEKLEPEAFSAEWKWDGIRVQLVGGRDRAGPQVGRVYSRTGEDITGAFPDLAEAITFTGAARRRAAGPARRGGCRASTCCSSA